MGYPRGTVENLVSRARPVINLIKQEVKTELYSHETCREMVYCDSGVSYNPIVAYAYWAYEGLSVLFPQKLTKILLI
jgi:hypothetical protein